MNLQVRELKITKDFINIPDLKNFFIYKLVKLSKEIIFFFYVMKIVLKF